MSTQFITTQAAAEHLGISRRRVQQLIVEGVLPAKPQEFSNILLIKVSDLKKAESRKRQGRPFGTKKSPTP